MTYGQYDYNYNGENGWENGEPEGQPWSEQQPPQQEAPQEQPKPAEPPPPPKFDPRQQVGHDGTTSNGWNREQYRDAWMGSGVNSVQGAKDWINQHGGEWVSDNGTVMTPFGERLDMLGIARGSAA